MKAAVNSMANTDSNLITYFRKAIYLIVLFGFSICNAGSYDDFFKAIQVDDDASLATLLARGFDGNTRDPKGQPGLYLAVREKSFKAAAVLMNWRKIDVEARNPSDESPLMLAALNGLTEISKKLIAKGADVN